ncbi:hypothetical protein BGX27_004600, partial [Mortierella sp. AM989]
LGGSRFVTTKGYSHIVLETKVDDMTKSEFLKWLFEFDHGLNRHILLIVDETLHRLLHDDQDNFQPSLEWIDIIKAPKRHSGSLPLSAGVATEFKAHHYRHLLTTPPLLSIMRNDIPGEHKGGIDPDPLSDYLNLIFIAWENTRSNNIA